MLRRREKARVSPKYMALLEPDAAANGKRRPNQDHARDIVPGERIKQCIRGKPGGGLKEEGRQKSQCPEVCDPAVMMAPEIWCGKREDGDRREYPGNRDDPRQSKQVSIGAMCFCNRPDAGGHKQKKGGAGKGKLPCGHKQKAAEDVAECHTALQCGLSAAFGE